MAASSAATIDHGPLQASMTAGATARAPKLIDGEPATTAVGETWLVVAETSSATTATTELVARHHDALEPAELGSLSGHVAARYDEHDGRYAAGMALVRTPGAEKVWLHLGGLDRDPRPRRGYWTHRRANLGARVGASVFAE
jgi:hypothetical protein